MFGKAIFGPVAKDEKIFCLQDGRIFSPNISGLSPYNAVVSELAVADGFLKNPDFNPSTETPPSLLRQ